ncbi:MAG: BACON domain-containing protein [Candidatus Hydrogenedentes bacterium]|nr:BACON domain-containing protein [Candidatus Hydrogenedentota bacterium]
MSANATGQNFAGSQAVLSVTPLSQDIGAGAADVDFNVQNLGQGTMNWTALVVLGTNWATLSGSPGTNNGTFRVSLQANNTGNSRETTVRVSSTAAGGSPIDVSITQAPASNLSVTPPTRSVSFGAGNTTFSVANSGGGTMNWNATVLSGGDWLEITSGDSGTDSGTINLSFDKNTGAQRTGTVRVTSNATATSQVDVTVVQSPAPDLLVTPSHRDLTAGSGTTTFDVSFSGGTGNQWSAEVISGNWLGITSAESGTDAGQIEVSYGSNSSDTPRNATIRFTSPDVKNAPVDVTLTQNGFTSLKVVTPNGGEIVQIGKQLRIKWQSQGLTGTIRVELFKNGSFKKTILQGQLNDGKQRWRVDGVKKGTGYQVRVVSESNGVISDLSDSSFEIVK